MRLADLQPHWIVLREGGDRVGITFRCPHCPDGERGATTYLGVWFIEPVDMDAHPNVEWPEYMLQHPDKHYWDHSGNDFDSMSVTPSVDASASGHWHGHITDGMIV